MPKGKAPRLKSRANKKVYEDRLRRVARFAIRGLTQQEIAEVEGVNQTTISGALIEIQKRNLASFKGKLKEWDEDREKLAAEINAKYDELEREAWTAATESEGSSKIPALKEIREINKVRIETLQRLGLIYEEPTKSVEAENYDELLEQVEQWKKENERDN